MLQPGSNSKIQYNKNRRNGLKN